MITMPEYIFFTGVPGSKWSGIANQLSHIPSVNNSDHQDTRVFSHHAFSGHRGAYFGTGMEFLPKVDIPYIDSAWTSKGGTKIVKSHEWALVLDEIVKVPNSWIMLVYRPDLPSFKWWKEAGGFNIGYPNYDYYHNDQTMLRMIHDQNNNILQFSIDHDLEWSEFNSHWVEETFGKSLSVSSPSSDVMVTMWRTN